MSEWTVIVRTPAGQIPYGSFATREAAEKRLDEVAERQERSFFPSMGAFIERDGERVRP